MAPSPPSCLMSSLVTRTFQYLEHTWIDKVLLLVFLKNTVSTFSRVNKLFRNMTQALWQCGHGWQGMWENTGRYLENFSPPMVWKATHGEVQDPDEVTECLKSKMPWLFQRGTAYHTMLGPGQHLPNTARYYAAPSSRREGLWI